MRFSADAMVAATGEHLGAMAQTALREALSGLPAALASEQAGAALLASLARQISASPAPLALCGVFLQLGGNGADLSPDDAARHSLLNGWVHGDAASAIGHALWCGGCFGTIGFGAPTFNAFSMDARDGAALSVILDLRFQTAAGEATALCVYGDHLPPARGLKVSVRVPGHVLALLGAAAVMPRETTSPETPAPAARPPLH